MSDLDESKAQTFSLEYVRELRAENKGYRLKLQETEGKLMAATQQAETQLEEVQRQAGERVLRARLESEAVRAGLLDVDGLKLADVSQVSLREDGGLEGAEALLASLREAKPYLFGVPAVSSSTGQRAPEPKAQTPRHARQMSAEEYAATLAKLVRG